MYMDTKSEQIFITEDGESRELLGKELSDFLLQRENDNAEREIVKKAIADKLAAKQSAQAKLAALGLSLDEVAAILGNQPKRVASI